MELPASIAPIKGESRPVKPGPIIDFHARIVGLTRPVRLVAAQIPPQCYLDVVRRSGFPLPGP